MMKYFTHTNAGKLKLNFRTKMNLLTTGLIFVLLLLSTFLGNGVMILLIHHGFINAGPPSSQIPLLIQTGIISIIIGTLITLLISHLPLKPLHTLVEAIHQVSTGNYDVKIHLEHPAEFREVSDCFKSHDRKNCPVQKCYAQILSTTSLTNSRPRLSPFLDSRNY